jgi:hypothetical protein
LVEDVFDEKEGACDGAALLVAGLERRGAEDAAKVWSLLALAELEPPIDSETMLHSKWIP